MNLFENIINYYSDYVGTGILMALFFVALIFVAIKDENRSNRTVLLYGSMALIVVILCPLTYYLYSKYVDSGTYWRFFWLIPVGIGLAYVAARLSSENKLAGIIMAFAIMVLGGKYVYTAKPAFRMADNPYKIPDEVITIADYLESLELEEIRCAVTPEILTYIRQYDINIIMPYGREQMDSNWGEKSGFYELMLSPNINFEALSEKCTYNHTRFLVVNNEKVAINSAEHYDFKYIMTAGPLDLYEYQGLDWNNLED